MRSDSRWPSQENDPSAYALTPVGEAYWWRSNCMIIGPISLFETGYASFFLLLSFGPKQGGGCMILSISISRHSLLRRHLLGRW